nr:hypothetical protein [Kiritimatiellia bacterium]
MNRRITAFLFAIALGAVCVSRARAQGAIYGDVSFHGSVYATNGLPAVPALTAVARSGGSWSNSPGITVWYRLA